MSRRPRPAGAPAPDVAAAELALGVLEGSERAAAEARAERDTAFAAAAAGWSARLHALATPPSPRPPPPRLWAEVEAGLPSPPAPPSFPTPAPAPVESTAPPPAAVDAPTVPPLAEPASQAAAGPAEPAAGAGDLRRWRRLAGAAGALAAVCAATAAAVLVRHPVASGPLLTAVLEPPGGPAVLAGSALYTVAVDRGRRIAVATAVSPGPVDPRPRELWLVERPGRAVALGVLAPGRPLRITAAAAAAARPGLTLAVTLEPPGGSRTGAPTGPVIAMGAVAGG